MKLSSNTILITGGGSGIGLALAGRFIKSGSKVLICGRDTVKLKEVYEKFPGINYYQCDLSVEAERIELFNCVTGDFPGLNVLINNAGIQQRIQFKDSPGWNSIKLELEINLLAQIHLTTLFLPYLLKAAEPVIINVTSGLAFSPLASVPVYSSTKAAFHSFTLSLRHQLRETNVNVIEVAPPAVQTDLGGKGLHDFGTPLDEFADAAMAQLEEGKTEVTYGFSAISSRATREELDEIFKQMNNR